MFLRKVLDLAYTARYTLGRHFASDATVGAIDFITGLCHMITYIGVIVVVSKLSGPGNQPTDPNSHPTPQAPPMMAQPEVQPQGQSQFYPQQQYAAPQQYGQEIKAFNTGSPPPQGYYPAPPPQNGYPQNGFVPQQHYSPPPQQQFAAPPQQGLAPQGQPVQAPSPVSSQSPQQMQAQPAPQSNTTHPQSTELPSTHY